MWEGSLKGCYTAYDDLGRVALHPKSTIQTYVHKGPRMILIIKDSPTITIDFILKTQVLEI